MTSLLTLSLVAALRVAAPSDSVVGDWKIAGEVGGTAWTEVCTLKQAATVVSGSCVGDTGIAYPVTGELKEGKLTFQHGGDYQGQEITVIFSASLDKPNELKGSVLVKPFDAAGSFTGAPAPKKAG